MDTYKKVYGKPAPKSRGRIHTTAFASRRGGGILLGNDKMVVFSPSMVTCTNFGLISVGSENIVIITLIISEFI